jgi:hypothetical protein
MARALTTIASITIVSALLAHSLSAHPAWGIVVDRNNQIYFSDIETVWRIDAQGKLTVFRAGVSETGFAIGADRAIFLSRYRQLVNHFNWSQLQRIERELRLRLALEEKSQRPLIVRSERCARDHCE